MQIINKNCHCAYRPIQLIQLPVPRLNFGKLTGNIPLGINWLKYAADQTFPGNAVMTLPQSISSYLGDAAFLNYILKNQTDIIGFSVFCWNINRTLYFAKQLKASSDIKIIFGGPEITPDNTLLKDSAIDLVVFGEGESAFIEILSNKHIWEQKCIQSVESPFFISSLSPYAHYNLEPEIEKLILLETQRGCPYQCGYCYYNKSKPKVTSVPPEYLLKSIQWAIDHQVKEIYLLDPSLDSRSDLKHLLKDIIQLNTPSKVSFVSEIRAERIDSELASLFEKAGFMWFEVGLQTTNPKALSLMKRPTDLKKFLKGVSLINERDILPRIDLIIGLPGDTKEGFMQSIDFIKDNNLHHDIQVFPLSILPGTPFRNQVHQLNIQYDPTPPYTIKSTDSFSAEDILFGLDYAESYLDIALFPNPDFDIAWRNSQDQSIPSDVRVSIGDMSCVSKLIIMNSRPLEEIRQLAQWLTHPYQLFFGPDISDLSFIQHVIQMTTSINPFTPLEIIFFHPRIAIHVQAILNAALLQRPHFLDNDLRYLYPDPGNRAMLITLVSKEKNLLNTRDMVRQVYWWQYNQLPQLTDLDLITHLDGILIDSPISPETICLWQDQMKEYANDLLFINFSDIKLQKRWLKLILPEDYDQTLLNK